MNLGEATVVRPQIGRIVEAGLVDEARRCLEPGCGRTRRAGEDLTVQADHREPIEVGTFDEELEIFRDSRRVIGFDRSA